MDYLELVNPFGAHTFHKTLMPSVRYSWCARDVMAAILDDLAQKNFINLYYMWRQHGFRIIVFWILRDWLQPTYIGHQKTKEPVKEQSKNKERTKNKKKQII